MNPTNHASGAMLVPDPEGQEFESGHSQFRNRKAGVSAKSATDIVDLAVAELGDGISVLKKLVVVKGGGYLVREAKDVSVPFDKWGRVSVSRVIANDVNGVGSMRIKLRGRVDRRFARDRRFAAGLVRESNGSV
jgi:hypothetical protein